LLFIIAMLVIHDCIWRIKCCSCFQWNDQNLWTALSAKMSFDMAQVVQDRTTLYDREGAVIKPPKSDSLCRRNNEDHWTANVYAEVLHSEFCCTTWVGGWEKEKKGKLYCTRYSAPSCKTKGAEIKTSQWQSVTPCSLGILIWQSTVSTCFKVKCGAEWSPLIFWRS
jgi:hypothetical protein